MVCSKRKVYTARLSFIWVVKRGWWGGCGISYHFVCTIFLYYRIITETKHFLWEWKAGAFGGGETGGNKLVFGIRQIPELPTA